QWLVPDPAVPRGRPRGDGPAWTLNDAGVPTRAHEARPAAAPCRAADLPLDRRRRGARDAVDRVRRRDAALQRRVDAGVVCDAARAAAAPVEPAGIRGGVARPRLQHRRVVHDEYVLAGLQRRGAGELSDADG